jgi:alkylation response protein AidB-like acyl-CoA dehydrogenase
MNTELQPTSEQGQRFVALAEEHAADFATRADQHDREASFPKENIEALRDSGFLAAPIPEELGGMGVSSYLDLGIGMSRLARGCASTAIAANMHISIVTEMARLWRARDEQRDGAGGLMRAVAAKQVICCGPNTENGTDLQAPMTEAVPDGEGHYVINGRKAFGTLSPVADLLFSSVRIKDGDGYKSHLTIIPASAPGVQVMDNWDALGMRASGSHDVVFTDVRISQGSLLPGAPWNVYNAASAFATTAINYTLIACFLGIAEAARNIALEMAAKPKGPAGKRLADRTQIQHVVGEMEVDLAIARAVLERAGRLADDFYTRHPNAAAAGAGSLELAKEHQAMKYVLQRKAIDIVDKAMTISGGAGYMSKHPLSRLYRDVRAGPFMQPLGAYEVLDFAGRVTLGIEPPLER